MFTGIITDVGRVRAVAASSGGEADDRRLEIDTRFDTETIALGASIACSGACLTVVDKGRGWFAVDVSAETLGCTTLGQWVPGRAVNLERALAVGDELGGHRVSGLVDAVAHIVGRRGEGDSLRLDIAVADRYAGFIAAKGSVTIDGVSLTVNAVTGSRFGVNLIPHTQRETTLGRLHEKDSVNLEIDVLARYVARLVETGTVPGGVAEGGS